MTFEIPKGMTVTFHLRPDNATRVMHITNIDDDDADWFVTNNVAVSHGDGGHYQTKHGTEKAVADADVKVAIMRVELDEMRAALDTVRALGRFAAQEEKKT